MLASITGKEIWQMRNMRRKHDAAFKAKVAFEAVKGEKTMSQLSSEYGVHPNQIGQWRKRLLKELPDIFLGRRKKAKQDRGRDREGVFVNLSFLHADPEKSGRTSSSPSNYYRWSANYHHANSWKL